jgi:hypothetical protein
VAVALFSPAKIPGTPNVTTSSRPGLSELKNAQKQH